jgi:hypothetical protein
MLIVPATWEAEAGGSLDLRSLRQPGQLSETLFQKREGEAGCRGLISIILPTWKTEIQRTEVQGQPRQKVHKTPTAK